MLQQSHIIKNMNYLQKHFIINNNIKLQHFIDFFIKLNINDIILNYYFLITFLIINMNLQHSKIIIQCIFRLLRNF